MTNLDLWILCVKLDLPVLLISPTKIAYNSEIIFKLNNIKEDSYIYIIKMQKTKILDKQKIIYKLIQQENRYKFDYDNLSEEFKKLIKNIEYININKYIDNYKRFLKKKLKIVKDEKDELKKEIKIKIKKSKKTNDN